MFRKLQLSKQLGQVFPVHRGARRATGAGEKLLVFSGDGGSAGAAPSADDAPRQFGGSSGLVPVRGLLRHQSWSRRTALLSRPAAGESGGGPRSAALREDLPGRGNNTPETQARRASKGPKPDAPARDTSPTRQRGTGPSPRWRLRACGVRRTTLTSVT